MFRNKLFKLPNKKSKSLPKFVEDYGEYEDLQKNLYCSYESENKHWTKGQERFIKTYFKKVPKHAIILDIACGDGVGLRYFKKMGFKNVIGVEFNHPKAELAKKYGYLIHEDDMHDLKFPDNFFDVIYSSHTLEHAFNPKKAVKELKRVLKDKGLLIMVLPYVDYYEFDLKAHVAKFELGLHLNDDGQTVVNYFEKNGFKLLQKRFDHFRQDEIWLTFTK